MNVRQSFTRSAAWMFAGNWVEQILNFAIFVLLARLLGVEAFGLAAMAAAFVLLSEFLVRETLTEALISRDDITPGLMDAAFWSLVGLSILLTGVILVIAGPLAMLYQQPDAAALIRGFAPSILMIGISAVPVALLRRDMRFRALSLRAMAGVVGGGVLGLWLALTGYGVWALVAQRLGLVFVNESLAWITCRWAPGFRATRQDFRDVMGFGTRVLGLRASELVSVQTPAMVAGPLLGLQALGFLSVSWRLTEIASALINRPIQMAAQPAFAALRREGGDAARMLSDILELSGLLALSAFLGMALLAEPLVAIVFGPDWAGAVPVLQAMSFVGFYLCVARTQNVFCLAAGQAGGIARIALFEALLGLAMLLVAARFGPVWAAIAFVARFYLLWPLRFELLRQTGGDGAGPFLRKLAPGLLGLAVMASAVATWQFLIAAEWSAAVQLLGGTVIGVVVMTGYVAVFLPSRLAMARNMLRGG